MRTFTRVASRGMTDVYGGSKTERTTIVREINFDHLPDLMSTPAVHAYHREGGHQWLGVQSPEELDNKLRNGWPELLKKMFGMINEITLPDIDISLNLRKRRHRTKSDFGNEVDIHAVRQGRMDRAWTTTEHRNQMSHQTKLVHLMVNAVCSAMVTADSQLWRAAAAMRILEALERDGKSVAVTIMFSAAGIWQGDQRVAGEVGYITCPVKMYGQHVAPERMAVMMAGGFWRQWLLSHGCNTVRELVPTWGYGMPVNSYEVLPMDIAQEREHGAHVLILGACHSQTGAEQAIKKFLEMYQALAHTPEGHGAKVMFGG